MLSGFLIVKNEEELLPYCLESFALVADQLDVLSVVDNGSTDATLDILQSWRTRLPLCVRHVSDHAHHGHLRTLALESCRAPWILYLDADETLTSNFREWFVSEDLNRGDIWEIWKYTTIPDRLHHGGGDGPSQRLFRNVEGVHFPQSIHTEPVGRGLDRKRLVPGVWMFDNTHCASREKMLAKGMRYLWANRLGVIGVGGVEEYTNRSDTATIHEIPAHITPLIFTGPL